jgi:hypothetical protein
MSTPRRPNGFQDRMRRDRTFRQMLDALRGLMQQPCMNPLHMTPEQRKSLREAHEKARAAINEAENRS